MKTHIKNHNKSIYMKKGAIANETLLWIIALAVLFIIIVVAIKGKISTLTP